MSTLIQLSQLELARSVCTYWSGSQKYVRKLGLDSGNASRPPVRRQSRRPEIRRRYLRGQRPRSSSGGIEFERWLCASCSMCTSAQEKQTDFIVPPTPVLQTISSIMLWNQTFIAQSCCFCRTLVRRQECNS